VNVCPPCFNFSDEDDDHTIQITMNTNTHHAHLKKHTRWEFEIFEPKPFVEYGRKMFDLATRANEQVITIIPSNACGHRFTATKGRNQPETIAATKKALDESGLVGITCCHGVHLRFLKICGGGARLSNGVRLTEAVMHEVPDFAKLQLCYDVACVFESTVYYYNPNWMEGVEARIGRLHIYGH